jgi:hypothetical protein
LGITFASVLPRLTAVTALGATATAAYAQRQGVDVDTFVDSAGPVLTAEQVGTSVAAIAVGGRGPHGAYLLTASGLAELK